MAKRKKLFFGQCLKSFLFLIARGTLCVKSIGRKLDYSILVVLTHKTVTFFPLRLVFAGVLSKSLHSLVPYTTSRKGFTFPRRVEHKLCDKDYGGCYVSCEVKSQCNQVRRKNSILMLLKFFRKTSLHSFSSQCCSEYNCNRSFPHK